MSKSPHDLPPLSAVAAFEAAARRLSFKEAAGELNVTPAAISRQVRNLETWFGRPLFRRLHRRVVLTEEGEAFFDAVASGFAGIAGAARALKGATDEQVTIGSTGAVARFWLVPRLHDFWRRYPDLKLHHVISDFAIDLMRQRVDLAVRFGQGQWPGLESRMLFADRIYPVAAPEFVFERGPFHSLDDLAGAPLLDVGAVREEGWLGWPEWMRAAGAPARPLRLNRINSYAIAVEAALDGQGALLGWHSLIRGLVAEGRLLRLTEIETASPGAYFLVRRADRPLSAEGRLLKDWLVEAAAADAVG
ncbi:MAG: LysR substrate-binding domain-containing protein [Alphaproteobacteria bacterium]|nr:LysR substrate-binding domain-containing protein [Alphaproteobacteria bacterium]